MRASRLLAWGGVVALAWLARGLLLPVFLAAALAYLLSPAVAWADALAIRRSVAVGALFTAIVTVLVVVGFLLGPGMVAETAALVDRLNLRLCAGQLPDAAKSVIVNYLNTIPVGDPLTRSRVAVYLIATSSQFAVQR